MNGLISYSGDKDYLKFTTSSSTGYKVRINLSNLAGDYDVRLYRNGSFVGLSQNGGTSAEQIIYNSSSSATYVVYIYGYNGANSATQCYDLIASTSSSNFRDGGFIEQVAKEGVLNAEEGMDVYPTPTKEMLYVNYNAIASGNANLSVMDLSGKILIQRSVELTAGSNSLDLNLGDVANGMYIVRMQTGSKVSNPKVQVLC